MSVKFKNLTRNARVGIGLITIICGFSLLWAATVGKAKDNSTLNLVRDKTVEIDALHPSSLNNNSLVLAKGSFSGSELIGDEFINPGPYLILKRRVEMYQWVETNRDSEQPTYTLEWMEGQSDFFNFKVPAGHENPLLKITPETKKLSDSKFSGFNGSKILDAVAVLLPLTLSTEVLRNSESEIENNKIFVRRNSSLTRDSLGDTRIWYEALPSGEYTIAARQQDELTLLGAAKGEDVVIRAGLYSLEDFYDREGDDVSAAHNGLLYVGATVLFFGVFSVLSLIAPKLDLRPKLEASGMQAILLVSAAISITAVVIFWVLGLLA